MDLSERLRAYNRSQQKTAEPAAAKVTSHLTYSESSFNAHPVSTDPFSGVASVAVDFTRDIPSSDLLFFDLETTGLGSSEQTYPFLIGAAEFHADTIILKTWFADTPAGESEMLAQFLQLAQGRHLVSFNGKSFDLPLVLRRAQKYGLHTLLGRAQHTDLYHTIRRIFPEKPARLIDAETRLLGFTRHDDLSGAAVAQAYFEYLRFSDQKLKRSILSHNESDVLSLVSLTERVSRAFMTARQGAQTWAYKIHRDKSAAATTKKNLIESYAADELDARDLHELAEIYRREKQYHHAARLFLRAYRYGRSSSVIDAIRLLRKISTRKQSATRLARFAIAREDERIQSKLVGYI